MEKEKLIREYIKSDIISFIHILDLLDKGLYTIEYASSNGFVIHDDTCNFTYISFNDKEERENILAKKRYKGYLAYGKEIPDYYGDTDKALILVQYYYESNKLFDDLDSYDIRKLDTSYAELIDANYKAFGPGESNKERLETGEVLGLFEDNKLAGIIGRHPEGCVGMLLIFKDYRHKGYATALEKAKMNDLINRGEKVYNEVVYDNEVSHKLQKKLGYTRGEKLIYWIFDE